MTGSTELLRHARERASSVRARYRTAGTWSAAPLDLMRDATTRHPTRVAVRDRRVELTFAELDARIDEAARALATAGVTAGVPVVLVVGNDVEGLVAIHAAVRMDAVVLLVARNGGARQLGAIVEGTNVRFGVAPAWPEARESPLASLLQWIDLGSAADGASAAAPPGRAADEPSFVLFTSGTTSAPKGVVHSLSTLAKASRNYVEAAGLTDEDRVFLISPLASVTGVVQAVFIGPMLGVPVILEDRWEPASTCELLLTSGATWFGGPDRLLDRLLDEVQVRDAAVPLRAVFLGGTMLDRRIVDRIEDEFGIVVMRAYGSSEVPVSTSGSRSEPREVRHGDDGAPLRDVEARVGSAAEPRECCIRGPHAFLGYVGGDDDHAFDGEWFRTGDVADLSGGRVRIVGRIKDIVIRNGLKIPAAEVEEAVGRIAGVKECAAYAVADAGTGERLAVAMVLQEGIVEMSLSDVAETLVSAGLPKYKLPEELVFWDEPLPLNPNGKVERNKLNAGARGRPRVLADRLMVAPQHPPEPSIATRHPYG